jgi:hypothetical protein
MLRIDRYGRILPVFCFILMWCADAAAQDPNVQERIESLLPGPGSQGLALPESKVVEVKRVRKVPVKKTITERVSEKVLEERLLKAGKGPQLFAAGKENMFALATREGISTTTTRTVTRYVPRLVTSKKIVPRKMTVSLEAPFSYGYVSNAFNSHSNPTEDLVGTLGPEVTVKIPVGAKDTFSILLNPGFVRYRDSAVIDSDSLLGLAAYLMPLREEYSHAGINTDGTKQLETLAFRFRSQTAYVPGFGESSSTFLTPSVEWALSNIALSNDICGKGDLRSNCYFARIAMNVAHSWSDNAKLDNSSAGASLTLGWNIRPSKLALGLSGSVTGRHYDRFTGGRDDLIFSGGPAVTWTPSPQLQYSVGFKYTRQLSTQSQLEWDGYQATPEVRIKAQLYSEPVSDRLR